MEEDLVAQNKTSLYQHKLTVRRYLETGSNEVGGWVHPWNAYVSGRYVRFRDRKSLVTDSRNKRDCRPYRKKSLNAEALKSGTRVLVTSRVAGRPITDDSEGTSVNDTTDRLNAGVTERVNNSAVYVTTVSFRGGMSRKTSQTPDS